MTPSEEYVANLCEKSFLPFWSFPNPLGKKDKELCDLLVVCGNNIIIISVKDIKVSNHKDQSVKYNRWIKDAIEASYKQIFGAERFLKNINEITLKNRKNSIQLPSRKDRKIYRIAIAFGSDYDFPLPMGFTDRGFVHVFDEKSTEIIISELDTITDFINYLEKKEKFLKDKTILLPEESDLFALYINTGLEFEQPIDTIAGSKGIWEEYVTSEDYKTWRERIEPSFIWDYMIEHLYNHHITESSKDIEIQNFENALRVLNQENRVNRIELGLLLDQAIIKKSKGRMILPQEDNRHMYVFMPLSIKNWSGKEKELEMRCIVARYLNPQVDTVLGISIGSNEKGDSVYDFCYHYIPEITEEFKQRAEEIREELGYFKKPIISKRSSEEKDDFGYFGL
tara:strand:+ start:389 stop:1576 length:1188 start_codon:yes stop_codon:yes gene_type:complete